MFSQQSDEQDLQLAQRAASGDERAFTAIMQKYKSPLFRFAYRQMADADDAEDIVQDTFIALHRNLARFNPDYKFSSWVFQIAMNKCRDLGRKQKTRAFLQRITPKMETKISKLQSDENPEQMIDNKQRMIKTQMVIKDLPQNLREPFILCVLEDLSQKQAAEILRLSQKAVETRIYRARKIISEKMGL